MRSHRVCYLALLLCSSSNLLSLRASAADAPASSQTFDQIVRLSVVEGDVRVSRGKQGERATGTDWAQAAANLPMASGFSLVTGTGRAGIEFEDASTIYLADNSVLVFDELTATGGIPYTELTLVSGTAILDVNPAFAGENFIVSTPNSRISLHHGMNAFMRLDSYVDATAFTPMGSFSVRVNDETTRIADPGQTTTVYVNKKQPPQVSPRSAAFAAFDDWTAKRIALRSADMAAAMKDSRLEAPIPGLADLNGQGTFFPCAPYGTCWEPTGGWRLREADPGPETQQTFTPAVWSSARPVSLMRVSQAAQSVVQSGILNTEYEDPFPCSPNRIRRLIERDPVTGKERVLRTDYDTYGAGYNWAVCHSGSWIHRGHRYAWVAGTHRHHHCPVHWVKYGGNKAYVPIHPHDVAGKPPINLKYGVFETDGKRGDTVERVAFDPGKSIKVLTSTPKEFLAPSYPSLQRAETPRIETHLARNGGDTGKTGSVKSAVGAITFDHKSQSFLFARQVESGGRSTMITTHFGGGNTQISSNGGFSHGGWAGGSGSNGAAFHSGSTGGGAGSHSGGGGGSTGGGSHGGGGGSAGGGASAGGSSHK